MIHTLLDFVTDFVPVILWWLLLFPVVILLATPIILLISLIGRPMLFLTRVGDNYRRVFTFWAEWGIVLVPRCMETNCTPP